MNLKFEILGGIFMWNSDKSLKLTHFLVRLFYVLLTVIVVVAPFIVGNSKMYHLMNFLEFIPKNYLVPLYICVPAGYVALVCLDKLLCNIKKEVIFDVHNVKSLRLLSWCCIFAAVVSALSGIIIAVTSEIEFVFFGCSVAEFFVAVVVRVVKNCFEKAIEIKEENDLTI